MASNVPMNHEDEDIVQEEINMRMLRQLTSPVVPAGRFKWQTHMEMFLDELHHGIPESYYDEGKRIWSKLAKRYGIDGEKRRLQFNAEKHRFLEGLQNNKRGIPSWVRQDATRMQKYYDVRKMFAEADMEIRRRQMEGDASGSEDLEVEEEEEPERLNEEFSDYSEGEKKPTGSQKTLKRGASNQPSSSAMDCILEQLTPSKNIKIDREASAQSEEKLKLSCCCSSKGDKPTVEIGSQISTEDRIKELEERVKQLEEEKEKQAACAFTLLFEYRTKWDKLTAAIRKNDIDKVKKDFPEIFAEKM